jgi:hypothetical protein
MRVPSKRYRRAAVISAILHLLVISIVLHNFQRVDFKREKVAVTERVTIEHLKRRTVVQARASREAAKVTQVAKAPVQAALARPVAYVPRRRVLVTPTFAPRVLPQVKVLPKVAEPKIVASLQKPAAAEKTASKFSDQQIAAIEHNLGDSIARDRDRDNPLSVQATAPAGDGLKHYGTDVSGLTDGGLGHSGMCSPVQSWASGGWTYYYLICDVRATDGTFDREGIPWPVRFHANDDPFEGTGPRDSPVAMPLPGWHLPAGEHVADGVRQYAAEHGVNF